MTESQLTTRPSEATGKTAQSRVRIEVQALRAFAVAAVILNHFWPDRLTGGFLGVDVFFVISGFLITSHLWREVDATGRVRFGRFWLRRARRLLPASLLVAAVALVGTVLLLPQTVWGEGFGQILASVLYVENWTLAATSVDYFQAAAPPTTVQHYWSLSVEEQFYLVWPLLVVAGAWLALRLPILRSGRRMVFAVLALVVVASLIASIVLTASAPAPSYFNTVVRAWEFGIGGLLALAEFRMRWARPARIVAALAGWVLLFASVIVFTGSMGFPGALALVPVVGTLLVIVAGDALEPRSGVGRLALRPIVWLGDVSYSAYLWHWTLLVLVGSLLPGSATVRALVLLAATLLLAGLTRRLVEDPVRRSAYLQNGPARRHLWLAGATAVVAVTCLVGLASLQGAATTAQAAAIAQEGTDCAGPAAMAPGAECPDRHELDSTDAALAADGDFSDFVTHGEKCIQDRDASEVPDCWFGTPEAAASRTVALVGDSHAGHWIGALDPIAEAEGWHVAEYMKSSCPAVLEPTVSANWYTAGAESCREWSQEAVRRIADDPRIDTVIVSSISRNYWQLDASGAVTGLSPEAYRSTWQVWLDAGKQVVVLADTPVWGVNDVPTCVVGAGVHDPCAVPSGPALGGDPMVAAVDLDPDPGLTLVDLNDFFCDPETCHVAIGGLVAIGDGNHMTRTFSRGLSPYLRDILDPVLAPAD